MKILSQKNKVLWVNSIGLRKPELGKKDVSRMFGKAKSFLHGLEKVSDNLYVFTPIVIPVHSVGLIKNINSNILELSLKYYIRRIGMKDVIYWSYMPNVSYILKKLKAENIVYHCVDEWSKFSFIDENIVNEERELCEMANLVLASARALYESRKRYNKNTFYISHGVDYDYFSREKSRSRDLPDDLAGISKPIAGFFGLIHEWIDLDLLEYIIRNNENINFVFIGKSIVDISGLERYPNAHFLGQKAYDELIYYAKHFDVGLIPFKVNELTVNVNPIKLKEYFAIGMPVISVNLPEVGVYEKVVRIAGDYPAFDRALKEEISGKHTASIEEIDGIAREETWEVKVDQISELIMKTCMM